MDQARYDGYNLISDVKTFYKVYILLTIIVKFEHGPLIFLAIWYYHELLAIINEC